MGEEEGLSRRAVEAEVAPMRGARDLPHNSEAEQAVLGGILMEERVLDQVGDLLKAEDFYSLAHQHVFNALRELYAAGKACDAIMVNGHLEAKGLLGGVVPRNLAFELEKGFGTAGNIVHYAEVVRDHAMLRQTMLAAQRVLNKGYESGAAVGEYLQFAEGEISKAANGSLAGRGLKPLLEAVVQATEKIEAFQKRVQAGLSPITGVPTGFPRFDEMTLGLQPGALVIIAARPSVGKTAFALNMASHACLRAEKKVAFFSLEMSADQLATRMLSSEAKLDWKAVSKGRLSTHDWEKIGHHTSKLAAGQMWIDDNFVLTPMELRARCRRLKQEQKGLDLVVIDYLQLMQSPSGRRDQSREREIAEISRSLKSLAKELGVPIVALSQLNRSVEKRKGDLPQLSDIRESGAIEQDADMVVFLHRKDEEGDGPAPPQDGPAVEEVKLVLAKQRQGPTGIVDLVFFKSNTFFAEKKWEPGG
jgi:replicative DNA helicase